MKKIEVMVDASKCLGYGTCVNLAPEHFDLPKGAAVVRVLREDVDADALEDVQEAVRACPVRALSLKEVV